MNRVEILSDTTEERAIRSQGETVGAGDTGQKKLVQKTLQAQFPAERSAGTDGSSDLRINDLYRNGLLFTAYDFDARTTQALRDFRKKNNTRTVLDQWNPIKFLTNYGSTFQLNQEAVANILMPRSQSDVDNISHKFNDVGESLAGRNGGDIGKTISNMASTAVFGALESVTQGIMADRGEQVYNSARSMYAGPDNRTKIFVWNLTPRTVYDLLEILKIYEIFAYYSYGRVGYSPWAKDLKSQIDAWYKETLTKATFDQAKGEVKDTFFEGITDFLTNVITVSNPTIWTVKNFGRTSSFDGKTDIFGPCQIQSIRFDKSPNGHFNGLAIAPNLPSTFVLEVTMREIMTLNRDVLFAEGM
ncbi:tail tube baseplate junction protein [Serratia phage Muldoon]|uniref:Tail tube baseplate junction protein n=1 Tax=Serratia phage Muldoon TaxID=2601678 RepID=A0A5P8PHI8_9CAUD|nr:baseplate tail tube cap [Serratia phage Muldoon]QFR56151.1 tail tube baseplate junction protein [Serratia phage Muldoon]